MYIHNNYKKNKFLNNKLFKKFIYLIRNNNLKKVVYLFIFILVLTPLFTACTTETVPHKGEWIILDTVMSKPRGTATANILSDGNVLIMGGFNKDSNVDTADIYSPSKNKIVKTIQLTDRRFDGYSTTQMKNGNIFICGGFIWEGNSYIGPSNTSKIFDINSYEFKNFVNMPYSPVLHKTVLLDNGHILVIHGTGTITNSNCKILDGCKYQIYNADTDSFYLSNNEMSAFGANFPFKPSDKNLYILQQNEFQYLYDNEKNIFKKIYEWFPVGGSLTQIDNENYLALCPNTICPQQTDEAYVYNIKTKTKTTIRNGLDMTWTSDSPITIKLSDGNVFIYSRNKAYIYRKKEQIIEKIKDPPIPVNNGVAIVQIDSGEVLLIGGMINKGRNKLENTDKIQVYKY